MFFKKKPSVDAEELEWVVATWRWLNGVLQAVEPGDVLRLPSRVHFPDSGLEGHARAEHDFKLVQAACGMEDWPCRLVAQRARPKLGATLAHGGIMASDPLGTYMPDGNIAVITYDPQLLLNRSAMLATFAHELAHYVLSIVTTPHPGGSVLEEHATDLATAHLGFGLICANTAFAFGQSTSFDQQGWSTSGQGYLPERIWTFATALFCELTATPASSYAEHTKPSVLAGIKRNRAYLVANPEVLESSRSTAPA